VFQTPSNPYLVPFDSSFRIDDSPTRPPAGIDRGKEGRKKLGKQLRKSTDRLRELQRILYAHDRHAILLVFQAMDAAGKDSTIRAVMTGINPAGCRVHSFKQPSTLERNHDFLWRTTLRLPEQGMIGIFNRSYYEEVLVVRVHPEFLNDQHLPAEMIIPERLDELWLNRYESIRDHEEHLARNGTVILKFFLHVSRDEQRDRFLDRLEEPEKHWKFSERDLEERALWESYMHAYEEALNATSRPWAPWYAIPADHKPFMRLTVSELIVESMESLDLHYPEVGETEKKRFAELTRRLESD
jgi:PPK2 family polyphosphate:nucleotide phosphotransferase